MACGEFGMGRMAEPTKILETLNNYFSRNSRLTGRRAIVTSGPTHEAIDPVRYITNHSSGKQGHAIAIALAQMGATTTLVTGPNCLPDPPGVKVIHVKTALDMQAACKTVLPADIAVCAAAVTDWRAKTTAKQKLKKNRDDITHLVMIENPDILKSLSNLRRKRPKLVIGFAAETERVLANAKAKIYSKGCDWVVANDVSPSKGTFAGDTNTIHLITAHGVEKWPKLSKEEVGLRLANRIAETFESNNV